MMKTKAIRSNLESLMCSDDGLSFVSSGMPSILDHFIHNLLFEVPAESVTAECNAVLCLDSETGQYLTPVLHGSCLAQDDDLVLFPELSSSYDHSI